MVTIIFSPALISAACINLLLNVSCLILQNARNESHSVSSPKAYTPSGLKIVYLIMLSRSNTWILLWNLDISKLIQIIRRFAKSCVKVRFFWFESLRASIINQGFMKSEFFYWVTLCSSPTIFSCPTHPLALWKLGSITLCSS